jgi:ribonuclease Z
MPVIGPVGVKRVVHGFLEAYALDTDYRVAHHGEHFARDGMKADVREVEPGVVYDEDGLTIRMFGVDHAPIEPAVGYRFDWNGTSVVISGDTVKSDNLIEAARDCDILVHEAMNEMPLNAVRRGLERSNPRMAILLTDAMDYHTPTHQVAEIARDAGVGKLVLTHLLPSIAPNEQNETVFVRGMAEIYDGPIIVGRDLMRITP